MTIKEPIIMKNNKLKLVIAAAVVLPLLMLSSIAMADEVTGTLTTGISSTVVDTNINGTVIVPPTASPVAGTYSSTQSVVLNAGSGTLNIHYTTDGSTPTCSNGTVYSGAIPVSSSEVITAISCYPENYSSIVASFAYAINGGGHTNSYTINVSAVVNGSISPSSVSLTSGSSQTYTITPNSGYQISSVLVDGNSVGAVTTYTFSNVTGKIH